MQHEVEPANPAPKNLRTEIVAAFSGYRVSLVASILTIFMAGACAVHLAKDVLEARTIVTSMSADEGVPQNLVVAMATTGIEISKHLS